MEKEKNKFLIIKTALITILVLLSFWLIYNVTQSILGNNDKTTLGYQTISTTIHNIFSSNNDGGVVGLSEEVPNDEKGTVEIPDEIKDNFQDYLDWINNHK